MKNEVDMKIPTNIIAGAAGALLLNLIHELARHTLKSAPRINEIGEEGIDKIAQSLNTAPPNGNSLYATTLASDLVGNAFYYSAVGKGTTQNIWLRGIGLGLTAGFGALALPSKLGLDDKPVKYTALTRVLTVAWYTIGGLAAAAVADFLKEKRQEETAEEKEKKYR